MALDIKERVLAELMAITDQQDKFRYLIEKGQMATALSAEQRQDKYLIKGCLSQLWLVPGYRDGLIHFLVDSDAAIPKGIAAVLAEIFSGLTPDEVLATDANFLREAGIEQHLSMNRRNGLANLGQQIRLYATAFKMMRS